MRIMIWNMHGENMDEPRVIDVQFFRRAEMAPAWVNTVQGNRIEPTEPGFVPSMRSRPGPNQAPVMNTSCRERFPNYLFLPAFPGHPGSPRIRFNATRDTIYMDLGSIFALNQFWMRDHFQNTFHGNTYVGIRRSTVGFNEIQNLALPFNRPADGVENWVVEMITSPLTRVTELNIPGTMDRITSVINSVEQEYIRLSRSGINAAELGLVRRRFDEIVWDVTHFFQAPPCHTTPFPGGSRGGKKADGKKGGPNRLRGG
ncbi:hypothetical protein DL98DRAFT_529567 [Cadophora sp. DSE1049]|nr:hypothetical protein DL98DRAFT_529567 [Cadophora sp. DSE1049]